MSLFYPKVWTAHILPHDSSESRFCGVYKTEEEATNAVKEKRLPGFDEKGWVVGWDLNNGTYNVVTVFDKGWIPR